MKPQTSGDREQRDARERSIVVTVIDRRLDGPFPADNPCVKTKVSSYIVYMGQGGGDDARHRGTAVRP